MKPTHRKETVSMKIQTHLSRSRPAAALLSAAFLCSTLITFAQPTPPDRPDRPLRPDAPRRERPPGDAQRPGLADASLSEEQRAAIRETMEASRKEAAPLEEKMRGARRELQEAIHADKI